MILKGETYYIFKLGLKGLGLLSQKSFINEDDLEFVLFCGLVGQHPDISIREIQQIKQNLSKEQIDSILNFSIVSPYELAEAYSKCGEIGISPSEFFLLTPEEADELYEGFLRRKQLEGNIALIAINQSKNNPSELIEFFEQKDYEMGSIEEREHTFKTLGINEV